MFQLTKLLRKEKHGRFDKRSAMLILDFESEDCMKANMGTIDRIARAGVALAILASYLLGWISGTLAIVLGLVGVVMLGTSLIGSCPLYIPFKINTGAKGQ